MDNELWKDVVALELSKADKNGIWKHKQLIRPPIGYPPAFVRGREWNFREHISFWFRTQIYRIKKLLNGEYF